MRVALTLSSLLASSLALGACNVSEGQEAMSAGSGEAGERSYSVGQFEGVSLSGSQNVVVTVGEATSVRAEGDTRALDRLEITVEDGTLKIGQKKNGNWGFSLGRNLPPTTIYVSTPSLNSAEIGGSGEISIDRVEGGEFSGSIGGSGDMKIASLRVANAGFSIAGSGGISAAGAAENSDVSVAGSGDVDLSGLETQDTSIAIVGSGDVRANARRAASVSIMGSGDAHITGTAQCTVKKSGSGDVRCGA